MKLCPPAISLFGLALLTTSCYNTPEKSGRHPGENTPANYMSGPAVGPGTTAGGSTAGPQPPAKPEGEHTSVEPTHSGGRSDTKGADHAGAAEPHQEKK